MTDRLYYTDPYCRSFHATVMREFEHNGRPAVTLDRTAFYPTSGGQPFDTGRLGSIDVVETIDADAVIHVLASPIAAGSTVAGEINWIRRFDHMQQHTGQHLLSAAFDRLFENQTVSFHMGGEVSTIDLAREMSATDIERAVDAANDVVWEDRAVSIRFASWQEAARLPLRKDPAREGILRLIDIGGFDLSACGGTHVSSTGAVGAITVLVSERHRGGARLTFACGGRAIRALRTYRDAVSSSVRVLSVLPSELPAAVERLQHEARDLQKQAKQLRVELAGHEGRRLAGNAIDVGGVRVVVESLAGWDATGLKAVATAATAAGQMCAVLVSQESPPAIVITCSPGVAIDARVLMKPLIERFGGRGGGRPDMAQGGGFAAAPEEVASVARELLQAALKP